MQDYIVQAMLKNDNLLLMGTDMMEEEGLIHGNTNYILLDCRSLEDMTNFYKKLTTEGESTHPIQKTFSRGYFGGLTDRFGNHWLFNCN